MNENSVVIFGGDDAKRKILIFDHNQNKLECAGFKIPFKNFFWGNKPIMYKNLIHSVSIGALKYIQINMQNKEVIQRDIPF